MNGRPQAFKSGFIDPNKVSSKHEEPEPCKTLPKPSPIEALALRIKLPWTDKVRRMRPHEMTKELFLQLDEYGLTRTEINQLCQMSIGAFYAKLKEWQIPPAPIGGRRKKAVLSGNAEPKPPIHLKSYKETVAYRERQKTITEEELDKELETVNNELAKLESPHQPTQEERETFFEESKTTIPGVGPDAPVVVNEHGAKQSASGYLFTDFHPKSLLDVAAVSYKGREKYGPRNWEKIDQADHINHSLTHIVAYLAGDRQEPHLAHAICRLFFAMGTNQESR